MDASFPRTTLNDEGGTYRTPERTQEKTPNYYQSLHLDETNEPRTHHSPLSPIFEEQIQNRQ